MEQLKSYLKVCAKKVEDYMSKKDLTYIKPDELYEGTVSYFNRGGKRLRPAIICLCAGALGGRDAEERALGIACGTELYHTYTLVHDDIIDNDSTRRGGETVHVAVQNKFLALGYNKESCAEYGRDVAILSGDIMHSVAIKLMCEAVKDGTDAKTVLKIIEMLEGEYGAEVVCGETVDTRMGIFGGDDDIISIMRRKTGKLFAFSAAAGALIGLDSSDCEDSRVRALADFAELCGIAFQLQDDILGVLSDEKTLGKPIGSDIREGKKTVILTEAYKRAGDADKKTLDRIVGKSDATTEETEAVKKIFADTGAIDFAGNMAREYIEKAKRCLDIIPKSVWRDILLEWSDYMSDRKL